MSDMSKLLSWGIENSVPGAPEDKRTELDPALLAKLFGNQKDDSTMMKESMAAILDPEVPLPDKETAFDNFEMLVENLDNANNIDNLKLWSPLISQLSAPEFQLRLMAAWCIGTATQNNIKSQEAMHKHGGVPKIVELILKDPEEKVRTKAVYALSSQVRNYEPSLKQALDLLPEELALKKDLDAEDMESIDELVRKLRERVKKVISA
ncbi:uncharacterized protein LAJ45_06121 [Morchella importuna]|uniref:Fes1-domain-containing protein n=1 Tax=Morchella conica CCBAS932 TaxID=1392247 RepID=A0A3N4L3H3_9PEZI|nr:uncharacterized protein LAJ45_06121 [Morchella importuna]KAH8149968.1 hypothetical protein LAJ45_06121 [Morchella importuna]RPB16039.1 Fes1-domain-containing protein [Morchella conica CCBAS932]